MYTKEEAIKKISRILRVKEDVLSDIEKTMVGLTGKTSVMEKIAQENDAEIQRALNHIGVRDHNARDFFNALVAYLKQSDWKLFKFLHEPLGSTSESLRTLVNVAKELANPKSLFVLKMEKAYEIVKKNPPPNMISGLGYGSVDELLEHEDLVEIFCAMRFIETNQWMHENFEKAYANLTKDDFEERDVKIIVLREKWMTLAEKFLKKKYHNVSHLKELGIIFIIPIQIDTPGETLRLFGLVLHYLHEVQFYSNLVKKYSTLPDFLNKLKSLLRGDVDAILGKFEDGKIILPIVQRYLAKDDPNDIHLVTPHVNSETLHWDKAENDIARLSERFESLDLGMWKNLGWVGDYFKLDHNHEEELLSFDLIDTVMYVVKAKEMIKYLYHHQESLWNKIFEEYLGKEKLEELIVENFDKGYIKISNLKSQI
ncbi:MAG: hypothetical protein UT37_C0003G0036 [Parcubacteria group bacterium GW2011_GWA2_39_18]|nr:MAG: hypothetical protein UT37_C0003G0036 [Parcubacteria group bacterium GW2011_GWA2_39_18]